MYLETRFFPSTLCFSTFPFKAANVVINPWLPLICGLSLKPPGSNNIEGGQAGRIKMTGQIFGVSKFRYLLVVSVEECADLCCALFIKKYEFIKGVGANGELRCAFWLKMLLCSGIFTANIKTENALHWCSNLFFPHTSLLLFQSSA